MMLLFLSHDGGNHRYSGCIADFQNFHLICQVPQHNLFHGSRCCRDRLPPEQPRHKAKHKATNAAQPIASTAPDASAPQLRTKPLTMLNFMPSEFA